MKPDKEPASSSEDESSSDEEQYSSSEESITNQDAKKQSVKPSGVERSRKATFRSDAVESDNSSASSEEDSDHNINEEKDIPNRKHDDDNEQWSDEEEDDADSAESESEPEDAQQSLSLEERLKKQDEKRAKARTNVALNDRRERRNRAVPIAKERLKAFKKQQQEEQRSTPKNDDEKEDDQTNKKRKSKHAPTEVTSRRRQRVTLNESGIGVEIGKNRYQPRDPRISSLSGHLDIESFEQNYGFLKDMQTQEIKTLKRKIRAFKVTGRQGQRERRKLGITGADTTESFQQQLQKMQQVQALQDQQALERKAKRSVKQKLQEQVAEGKHGVYYPKRQELKRMTMEAKVDHIKKEKGKRGLDKYLVKKRKRQKSQLAKKMRSVGEEGRTFAKGEV